LKDGFWRQKLTVRNLKLAVILIISTFALN